MKSIYTKYLLMLSLLLIAVSSCDEEDALDLRVSRVQKLYAPDNKASYSLNPAGEDIAFLWSDASAADQGLIVYEVVFDTENGDFSNPVYRVAAENKGLKNMAAVSHKVLNKAAAAAGANAGEIITLKWAVASSKGDGRIISTENRSISVKRLEGFVDIPTHLYITGEGTEVGQEFKAMDEGEFEIFTYLKAEKEYSFVDATSSDSQIYSNNNGVLVKDGSATVTQDGVYHVIVDFNSAAVSYSLIKSFDLYFSPISDAMFTLQYDGQGIWKASKVTVTLKKEDWGTDDRYKFRMIYADGSQKWYGSTKIDNNPPDATTSADYFKLNALTTTNIWDYTYKFNHSLDGANINMTVSMQANSAYTHKIEEVEKEVEEKELPTTLYLNGSISESGRQFKELSSGVFEIFTLLEANRNFNFADALTGDINIYSANKGTLVERGSSQVVTEAPYRIKVDFNTNTATLTIITNIELFFPYTNRGMFSFSYSGNGEWTANNVMINLKDEWDRMEDRYKFRFIVNGGFVEWYGSTNRDNGTPNPDTDPSYYYLNSLSDGGIWDYTYKFDRSMHEKRVDMVIKMNGNNYTHQITKIY